MEAKRRVLVVGNSDGIGLGLTRRLLALGYEVSGVSRRPAPIDDATYAHAVLDVAAADYAEALAQFATERGPFATCVYCAGIGDAFDEGEIARAPSVMRVNLVGATETAGVVLPPMIRAGAGHFVALSSIGDVTNSAAPSYGASKAGLSAWLGGLALALRPRGVHVTNVRLGFVDTKMAKSPVRPMMISVDRAVAIVIECLEKKPAQRTYPRTMQLVVTLVSIVTAFRIWLT